MTSTTARPAPSSLARPSTPLAALMVCLAMLTLAPAPSAAAELAEPTTAERELLAATDLFAAAPEAFRSRLSVVPEASGRDPVELEIWRSGEERTLVRFLAGSERGKYLIRRGDDLFFLAPGSRRALPMSPSHRLQGVVSLDEILGFRLAEDYRIDGVERRGGTTVFHLTATADGAPWPKLRWTVDTAKRLPVRGDLLFADGRVARVVEIAGWKDTKALVPEVLTAFDAVRGGRPVQVTFEEMEGREVPAALFDLEDGAAREKLFGGR